MRRLAGGALVAALVWAAVEVASGAEAARTVGADTRRSGFDAMTAELRAMQQEAIAMTRGAEEAGDAERGVIADDAARLQDGIAAQAKALLDRLAEESGKPSGVEPKR